MFITYTPNYQSYKRRKGIIERIFAAAYGMEVLDCGVALLSMHAPWELASKADVYETSRAYAAFLGSDARIETYR